ncbi:type II toxin-antitoxin system RelE family toxin [Actinomadura fibrosa]|uniref:Type II toxin-antitoxin system RelE/ParE family toxin n=1 Tax=Actinomadura fibrosa TaxID=111802 RepID=A0ABW2XP62_9ACTN|nr:type II toxin-antitoxin system RelE/ParE family toxin [Actinomadura fibrosa]
MPQSVRWLPTAWAQLLALPDALYKEGLAAAAGLMVDPFPDDAVPDEEIPDTFRLHRGMVRIFYRVVQDDVDVVGIWPNS